jgi:ABC-type antimicrobial peptide transport system permease subunit
MRHLVVRAADGVDPAALAPTVRGVLREIDAELPIEDVRTMAAIVDGAVATRRLTARLIAVLAAVAVGLTGVGVYGSMAYRVAVLRREIGVRIALGAGRGRVARAVLARGLRLALAGAAVGLAGALALARGVESMLYEVPPTDPLSFAGAAATLVVLALAAALLPAWRAARIDPAIALRPE